MMGIAALVALFGAAAVLALLRAAAPWVLFGVADVLLLLSQLAAASSYARRSDTFCSCTVFNFLSKQCCKLYNSRQRNRS